MTRRDVLSGLCEREVVGRFYKSPVSFPPY